MKSISQKPLSNQELGYFCSQLYMIVKSGISVTEGLSMMREETSSRQEKEILSALIEEMYLHGVFNIALETVGLFPEYMVNMVKLGEETGTLDEVLGTLQRHYERETAIRKSVRSAVTYPAAMTGMMLVVIVVLLTKVMPLFNRVFIQLGTEMSGLSGRLLGIGNTISRYSLVLTVLLAAVTAAGIWLATTEKGSAVLRNIGYKIPLARNIMEKTSASRLAGALSLILKSGINIDRGLELCYKVSDDTNFHKKLDRCKELTQQGVELSKALMESKIFTGMVARISSIGAKTGAMDNAMEQIAAIYQEDIDDSLNAMLAVIEPALVVMLSLMVGAVLLSVMLPLMGIMSGI